MNFCEKKARIVWRTKSVEVTRVMPSRCATSVATVDLPVPVAPPTRSTMGQIELAQRLEAAEQADGLLALVLGEDAGRHVVEPLGADCGVLVRAHELALDQPRELVGALGADARAHERLRHEPLRVREADLSGDERLGRTAVGSSRSCRPPAIESASASTRSSRSGSPPAAGPRCRRTRPRSPRVSAASATTSIAAALISTR